MARKRTNEPTELMIINDVPGEETRIAILQDTHLEELYTERNATATNVGNIYKGRVVNVEPAIQAAFIDFGEGQNGFLHISDLHPRYFPGKERTERVGSKIPHRERPPIQHALKRGDQVLVQVLKEGLGTKGPTLTSYLSIPGRLLVSMPYMDRGGVSRKVEDEEQRREMRKILDSLDLPEGFGFIVRTAGFGQPKRELQRDAAYLTRLWKAMEKRMKSVGAPCELYTESDLLIRTIRDVLRPSIHTIVVDSESAFDRAQAFLNVVAPRSSPTVVRYTRHAPIFHAFDVERQIDLIHSREVPLPSGGRLVIDQTEALVAIDVNSGKSRAARDSETNAYATNCEAVDEICRQLRLRDLGGLIIHDLIDMRAMKHRRAVEERMTENLKRDRARTTTVRISDFGILEMTRQRMRPSMRSSHFVSCPTCHGHGEIKSAESVAGDAVRHIGFLLQYEEIARVEIVCSPRVASVLLSAKRRELVRMEDHLTKKIDVRVSDAIPLDRVDFYAYDFRNADIDMSQLPPLKAPRIDDLIKEAEKSPVKEADVDAYDEDGEEMELDGKGRRRRRRRKPAIADATAIALEGGFDEEEDEDETGEAAETHEAEDKPSRRRRRRRRGGRGSEKREEMVAAPALKPGEPAVDAVREGAEIGAAAGAESAKPASKKKRRRRGRGGVEKEAPVETKSIAEPAAVPARVEEAIRVHTFAKELGVSSKDLIDQIRERSDIEVKSHMSSVPGDRVTEVRAWFAPQVVAAADAEEVEVEYDESDEADARGDHPQVHGVGDGELKPAKRRRGRRGGRRRRRAGEESAAHAGPPTSAPQNVTSSASEARPRPKVSVAKQSEKQAETAASDAPTPAAKKRTRRGGKRNVSVEKQPASAIESKSSFASEPKQAPKAAPSPNGKASAPAPAPTSAAEPPVPTVEAKKPARTLYRRRTKVTPAARAAAQDQE